MNLRRISCFFVVFCLIFSQIGVSSVWSEELKEQVQGSHPESSIEVKGQDDNETPSVNDSISEVIPDDINGEQDDSKNSQIESDIDSDIDSDNKSDNESEIDSDNESDLNLENSSDLTEEEILLNSIESMLMAAQRTELVIGSGETMIFTNNNNAQATLSTDAKSANQIRYDRVTYNAQGKTLYTDLENTGNVSVPGKGGTTIITADYGFPVTVTFTADLSYTYSYSPALLKKRLEYGESYRFINRSLTSTAIMSNALQNNGVRYDYAVYKEDGSFDKSNMSSIVKPTIGIGSEIVITNVGDTPPTVAVPYEGFIGVDTDELAYDSVILRQGESYEFTNVGTKTDRVKHDGSTKDKFDYVVYLENGAEASRGTNTSTLPLVAVGRKVSVTLMTGDSIRVGAPYRVFMSQPRDDQSIQRVTLNPGESYQFVNQGSLAKPINNNARAAGGKYDYTVYKSDGSYNSQGFDAISVPTVPAGGTAIITIQGNSAITFEYTDSFFAGPSLEPSHFRVTLAPGQSYQFNNISNTQRYLRNNATSSSRFNWVEYYSNGTEHSKGQNVYSNTLVSSGNYIVVTPITAPITFGANYRIFSWEGKSGEAISKLVVNQGESYIVRNQGDKLTTISSDVVQQNSEFDVVVYNEKGKIYSTSLNKKAAISIPAQGYAIITGQSVVPTTFLYTDSFTAESSLNPALLSVVLNPGKFFTFTNNSDDTKNIYSNASSEKTTFSYVIRYPDGTIYSQADNRTLSVPVPSGYSITVSPVEAPLRFGGAYTVFTGSEGEVVTKQVTLQQGDNYIFTNILDSTQNLQTNASEGNSLKYDYAIYDQNGKSRNVAWNHQGDLSVSKGSQVVVTVVSKEAVTFKYGEAFSAGSSDEPALLKKLVQPKEQVTFKNKGSYPAKLTTDAKTTEGRFYDYKIIDANGVLLKQEEKSAASPEVPQDGTIQTKVTSTNPVTFVGPYRYFELAEDKEYIFEDLVHKKLTNVYKAAGENGYYRFVAPKSGWYRFIAKELMDFSLEPVLSLYSTPNLQSPLHSTHDDKSPYGEEYTILEFEMNEGDVYYLKLSEKKGKSIELQLLATVMTLTPKSNFKYSLDGRLQEIVYPTGDKLIYEYDANGNLKRRYKKVFPF